MSRRKRKSNFSNIIAFLRISCGLVYLSAALFHYAFVLPNHEYAFTGFAESALSPMYRHVISGFIIPYSYLAALSLIITEIVIGSMILWKGNIVKVGLVAGIVLLLILAPAWKETIPVCLGLVLAQFLLLFRDYRKSIFGI